MSWLYQSQKPVVTKHNGTMMLSRLFGKWTLWGYDYTHQASPYMNRLWSKTFRDLLRRNLDVRRCLILGVALGATFGIVQKAWPDAEVIGIDWEPTLFALGKTLGIVRPGPRTTFIEGDAAEEILATEGSFDLIIIDLFNGGKVSEVVSNEAFRTAVVSRLSERGAIAVNCYNQRQFFEEWPGQMGQPRLIHHEANVIGIFGPKP